MDAAGAGQAVEFSPFLPPAKLHEAVGRGAGVMVVPLQDNFYNRNLTCPVKALDALSHGLPSVSSDLPSARAVLGDSAVYIPPGDAKALGVAILGLFDDPERYATLATIAAQRADVTGVAKAGGADPRLARKRRHPSGQAHLTRVAGTYSPVCSGPDQSSLPGGAKW